MASISAISFAFLVICWGVTRALQKRAKPGIAEWGLIVFNLVFLATDGPASLATFLFSSCLNFGLLRQLRRLQNQRKMRLWLGLGVLLNTLIIFSPKMLRMQGTSIFVLGLSYYSIQQIMALVDLYEEKSNELEVTVGGDGSFRSHLSFTSFFPQLTAGPICSWEETGDQLQKLKPAPPHDIFVGVLILLQGLFQKVVLAGLFGMFGHLLTADPRVAPNALLTGLVLTFYYLELYFGFSGYTDIALGIGRIFGVKLPLNFNQPLRALSLAEFWTRWHMTLSSFVKNYIYFPALRAYGSSKAIPKLAMILAMLVVGIWHELSWRLAVFGILHGLALLLWPFKGRATSRTGTAIRWLLTQGFVVATLAFWKAPDVAQTFRMLSTLSFFNIDLGFTATFDLYDRIQLFLCLLLTVIHMRRGKNTVEEFAKTEPNGPLLAWFITTLCLVLLYLNSNMWSKFVYADF